MKHPIMISGLTLILGLGLGAGGYALLAQAKSPRALSAPKPAQVTPTTIAAPMVTAPQPASLTVLRVIEDFLGVEWSDSVALISASGELHALDTSGVRQAWQILENRAHTGTHQEKALALYLWSRLARLDPSLQFPERWSRDMDPDALVAARVRLSMERYRERLLAGESIDPSERKAFFKELAAQDAAAGLDFWLRVSNHLEHIGELSTFGALLRDPATREATLARIRSAASSPRDAAELITALAGSWIVADLHASAAWISTLADPDLKKRLESVLLDSGASALPATTFEITESMPVDQRTGARATGIGQLAYEDPATGMLLLDTVKDPSERRELIRVFGNTLAMHDTEAWLAWRETLPDAEQNHANSTAFTSWAVLQPTQAAAWLQAQPADQTRDQLAAELVRITAVNNTDTAISWINQISNPRDRLMAISMALGNLTPGDTRRMETILRASLPPGPVAR